MYELVPFKVSSQTSKIKIYAEAFKTNEELSVNFIIEDKNKIISFSDNINSGRKNELWKSTCFEAFFGPTGSAMYWELNLATGGSWNCYSFDNYRNPSEPREETGVSKIGFTKTSEEDGITRLEIKVPIHSLNLKGKGEVTLD